MSQKLSYIKPEMEYGERQDIVAPDHYVKGRKIELYDVLEDWCLVKKHYLACAMKYLNRAGRKGDEIEDCMKAITYLKRHIKLLEKET